MTDHTPARSETQGNAALISSDSLFVDGREGSPVEPESTWYDEDGRVIVTNDDRWHGYASQFRAMVESLSDWNDPAVWQYKLDLLRDAIDHEQPYAERALRQMREDTDDPNDDMPHPARRAVAEMSDRPSRHKADT